MVSTPRPTFQELYNETINTTVETAVAPIPGRDEVMLDSSGVGVATVKTKAHALGTFKTVATLTNDDVIGILWAPFFEVTGAGVAGTFIVGFGAPPVQP